MKKSIALLLALVMMLSLFAGCGSQEKAPVASGESGEAAGEAEEMGLIGFCANSLSESIWVLTADALEAKFAGKATVQAVSSDNNPSTQASQIRNFITMGADLIIICPTDVEALADAIVEAHEAGVKVYINGTTNDIVSPENYDMCTISDEYLCGAYIAMIAKNWIEAHADELNAACPDWEIAFLKGSQSDETLKRSYGEMSIVEPYLKDWEGNYVDTAGNIVDEADKVANPAYCELAAQHYTGMVAEQDAQNAGLNVANILTTNPNTRVFIAYNSLASVQGGQYLVDNYADQIDEFAFFSGGVMGNEADYMVGSVSETVGVRSVMRGAVQFGVSEAGGEVADSIAHNAYAIMYGEEGVDYQKHNPDGIAAWWAVDEEWGNGTASVAHFNITSGATVEAFDPIDALSAENTVYYWNSKDGYVESEEAAEDLPEATGVPGEIAAGEYSFLENSPVGEIKWVVTLNADGSFVIAQPENADFGNPSWTGTEWVDNGNGTFTTVAAQGEAPMLADFWQKDGSLTWINNGDGTVTPVGYSG